MTSMGVLLNAKERLRERQQQAKGQRLERERNEFINASVAIEQRADELLKASKRLLKEAESCLPRKQ